MASLALVCLTAAWLIALAVLAHIALLHNSRNSAQLRDWRWMKWTGITGIGCSTVVLISASSEDARSSIITDAGLSNLWVHIGMGLLLLALYVGMTRCAVRKIRELT